jgi:ribosomal protein L37AE/L43A
MSDSIEYPDDWYARRVAVQTRDSYTCQECGDQPPRPELHVDHVTPISEGGGHEIDNLRALCADCHADRHDTHVCAACSLLAHYTMDEVKKHGSVGLAHLCRDHYQLVADRAPDTATGARIPFDEVVGECVFCRADVNGRYVLAEHARDGASAYLCGECRVLVSREGRAARRELAGRVQRDEYDTPDARTPAEQTQD